MRYQTPDTSKNIGKEQGKNFKIKIFLVKVLDGHHQFAFRLHIWTKNKKSYLSTESLESSSIFLNSFATDDPKDFSCICDLISVIYSTK